MATNLENLLVSAKKAAKSLGVSDRTLWALTKQGEIPAVRIGRRVLYAPADLHRFIEANKEKGSAAR